MSTVPKPKKNCPSLAVLEGRTRPSNNWKKWITGCHAIVATNSQFGYNFISVIFCYFTGTSVWV